MSGTEKLKPAASVILLKPAQPHGFEVLLLHRPDHRPVHGGMHCFPRGSIRKSDHAEAILRRCRGLSGEKARRILGAHFAPPEALGYWIAAIRTLFEEVGILIAVKENGEPITSDAELNVRLLQIRAARRDRALDFPALMERENLFCDAAKLAYFSHWQTPAEFSSSFDTRFFLAAMPENPTPLATAVKVTHGPWLAPDRALQLFNRGELPMPFATFASLRTLANFGSVQSVLKEFEPEFT
jgi:8-oxo-dGTP pyrophosphatase MutT (NUDIX family)